MEYTPRLKKKYNSEIVNNLMKNYKSVMQVPKLTKISINQGVGNAANDKKLIEAGAKYIALSSFIWDNPKLKPEQAIKKFK